MKKEVAFDNGAIKGLSPSSISLKDEESSSGKSRTRNHVILSDIEIARQSARGSSILFLGNLLSAAIQAVAVIVIARLLGVGAYGAYTLALLIPGVLQYVVGLGVINAITRFSAYYISKGEISAAKRITKNGIIFLLLFGVLLSLASFFGSSLLATYVLSRPDLTSLVRVSSFIILGQTVLQAATGAFVGWNSMWFASAASVLQAILKLGVSVALILVGVGVLGGVIGQLASYLIAGFVAIGAIMIWTLREAKESSNAKGEHDSASLFARDIKEMVSFGLPLFAGNAISGLASQYVTILLAGFATNAVVGFYQAAVNVTTIITLSSSAVSLTLLSAFSSLSGIAGNIAQAFRFAVKYVSYFVTPIVVLLVAAGGPLMELLYGPSYSQGVIYLKLLAVSYTSIALGITVLSPFFSGIGRTRFTMIFSVVSAAVLVFFATLFSRALGLGVYGLIYAAVISGFAGTLVGLLLASKYLKATIEWGSTGGILLSSGIALLAVYFLPQPTHNLIAFLLDCAVFFAVYFTVAPLIRALNDSDVARLQSAMQGLGILGVLTRPILRYEHFLLVKTKRK